MGLADDIKAPPPAIGDFARDPATGRASIAQPARIGDLIEGVTVTPLAVNSDERGSLVELLTTRDEPIEPIVHVYQVLAEPGSVRAWVYHGVQHDRLAFVNGKFRVVLYDIRDNSPTRHKLNVFEFGSANPCRVRIPPFVAHGVKNIGEQASAFINLPTKAYQPGEPDKFRLPANDPRIPFSFAD